jgi:hypothetical protein
VVRRLGAPGRDNVARHDGRIDAAPGPRITPRKLFGAYREVFPSETVDK